MRVVCCLYQRASLRGVHIILKGVCTPRLNFLKNLSALLDKFFVTKKYGFR